MGKSFKDQFQFSMYVGMLIQWAYLHGYTIVLGDAWAKKGEGRPHSSNSKHYESLAIDINLCRNGRYLSETEDHAPLGRYWKSLHPKCTWGGDFKDKDGKPKRDGNHYSWNER